MTTADANADSMIAVDDQHSASGHPMFAKLLTIILAAGATACVLLVVRQERIETYHRISTAHERLLNQERALWQLRLEIAEQCRPASVRLAAERLDVEWEPLMIQPVAVKSSSVHLTRGAGEPVHSNHSPGGAAMHSGTHNAFPTTNSPPIALVDES